MVDCSRSNYSLKDDVEYRHKTGRLLMHRIGQLFAELGYCTWISKGQSTGLDLKVWDCENNLVIVAEILNWGPDTNLNGERKRKIIDNLSGYECNKLLIYTNMNNEYTLDGLGSKGISTLRIGYQIFARYFYPRLKAVHKLNGREIDSRETTLHLKQRLKEHLQALHTN